MEDEITRGWTLDTLFIHFEYRIADNDKRYEEQFKARAKAVDIAMQANDKALRIAAFDIEKRFASVNEFRQALEDQTSTYMPRSEYIVQHKALEDALNRHIIEEYNKRTSDDEKQDAKIGIIKEKLDIINKWLLGLMGGVVVALILTIIDLIVRGFIK
jgi:hypothetical protein